MNTPARRIVSLLPSATEIVCALGLGDRLIAVTHECDYPPDARSKPRVTVSAFDPTSLSSYEIDRAVRESLVDQATIYHLDRDLIEDLEPDLILTQELCTVCAVGTDEVKALVEELPVRPQLVSLEPQTLGDVFDSMLLVGRLTGRFRRAFELTAELRARVEGVREAVSAEPVRKVLTLEWLDPFFVGGHWVPEMVEIAGGCDVLGEVGKPSREASQEEVVRSAADVVVAMPCGYGLDRSLDELATFCSPIGWNELPAVGRGEVYAVDGSSYFSRPGPRLVDGVEILASILHPDVWTKAPVGSFDRVAG
ncbi:MAG TPA: cobalamin-binding protein [Chloroflexota bacterium]